MKRPDTRPSPTRCTRLAPSPTGALHLGNAMAFAAAWAIARAQGWRVVLRIEDLDGPRVRPEAAEHIELTLRWLGVDWDCPALRQSDDLAPYVRAMDVLARRGLVYPSEATRRELEHQRQPESGSGAGPGLGPGAGSEPATESGASAPNAGASESNHPASLRPPGWSVPRSFELTPRAQDSNPPAWRFATPDREVFFTDLVAGPQTHRPAQTVGDFPVWTKQGVPAYQLAVVVDDQRQGVTDIIRGNDLLGSAARQLLLREAIAGAPLSEPDPLDADSANTGGGQGPRWWHLPLVVGLDGRRLAKRHGDTRVDSYRASGVGPERVVGLVAWWLGAIDRPQPLKAIELPAALGAAWCLGNDPASSTPRPMIPARVTQASTITFTPKDHQWLTQS